MNLAARIQSIAPPDEIWISSKTLANLGGLRTVFEMAETVQLKGKSKPENVYKFVPNKVGVSKRVLLYEKDKFARELMQDKLKSVGTEIVKTAENKEELQNQLKEDFDTMLVGPNSLQDLPEIQKMAALSGHKKQIMIPVANDIKPESLAALEKLGIKAYIPYNEGKNLETSLANGMRNQAIAETKSATAFDQEEENPPPDEPSNINMNDSFDEVAARSEKNKIKALKMTEDGYAFSLDKGRIIIRVVQKLNPDQQASLKKKINEVWIYEFNRSDKAIIVLDFDDAEDGIVNEELLHSGIDSVTKNFDMNVDDWPSSPIRIKTEKAALTQLAQQLNLQIIQ